MAIWLVAFCPGLAAAATSNPRPNILFILCDDLGWSDSTLYGTTKLYETPNIEMLAKRGMLFSQAYAHPMCSPTRSSIMTGLWPARTGVTEPCCHVEDVRLRPAPQSEGAPWMKAATPWGATRLDTRYRTLAEALHEAGYVNGHFAKWHLGREPYDPLHRGFDVDIPHTYGPTQPGQYYAPWKWPTGVKYDSGNPGEYVDDRMADEAIRFMKAHRAEPFFCNFWMFSPHGDPQTTPELGTKYTKKIAGLPADYPQRNPDTAGLHESLDRVVGRLVKALDELNLTKNTIIVFNSDNGGWTGTSGRKDVAMTSNHPLRGGKTSLYEGGIRVPLIVVWPGHVKPGTRSDAVFSSVDFYPTLLDMVGLQPLSGQPLDGVDQLPALLGKGRPRNATFTFFPHYDRELDSPGAAVRQGDWKLIRRFFDNEDQTDCYELFNLHTDPGEQRNLAVQRPEKVRELDDRLSHYLTESGAVLPVKNPKYDPAARKPVVGSKVPGTADEISKDKY